jgi:hypothetical protein
MYSNWVSRLKEGNEDKDFHLNLVKYKKEILNDIKKRGHNKVAKDLNIYPNQLSLIKKFLILMEKANSRILVVNQDSNPDQLLNKINQLSANQVKTLETFLNTLHQPTTAVEAFFKLNEALNYELY